MKNRWIDLSTGTFLLLFCGLIYGWSLLRTEFEAVYTTWTASQVSLTFTLSMTFTNIAGLISGRMLLKHSPMPNMILAALLVLAGFVGISFMDSADSAGSLLQLHICYGVLAAAGIGFGYNTIVSTVNKKFQDRQGVSTGFLLTSYGLGGFILGGVFTWMVKRMGVFMTFRVLGIIMFVLLILGGIIFVRGGSGLSKRASGSGSGADAQNCGDMEGLSPSQMLRTSRFWLMALWSCVLISSSLMIVNSASPIAAYYGAPAILGMAVSVCNGAGRLSIGIVFDKLGRKRSMLADALVQLLAGITLLAGGVTESILLIVAGIMMAGLGFGGLPTLSAVFASTEFGPKYFSSNVSIVNCAVIPASFIGPMLSGFMQDMAGGDYVPTFIAMIVLSSIGILCLKVMNRICAD